MAGKRRHISAPALVIVCAAWATAGIAFAQETTGSISARSANPEPEPTLEQMVGEMLIVGFHGTTPDDLGTRRVAHWLSSGQIGGVILFRENIRSYPQTRNLIGFLKASTRDRKPFVMVDQEGGAVQRFTRANGFKGLEGPKAIIRDRNAPGVYRGAAVEMADVGVNVNLGPVVDLDLNRKNPIIGKFGRSYGADARQVVKFARLFIWAHKSSGILTAAKHFPGHGSSASDSHRGPVDISATWRPEELEPYRDLAKDDYVDMVLVGHLTLRQLGATDEPVSLSRHAIEDVLRKQIGFKGLVVTDDLDMGAIRNRYPVAVAAVRAIAAGNDLLIISNLAALDPDLPRRIIDAVRHAVATNALPVKRLRDAHGRIEKAKSHLGVVPTVPTAKSEPRPSAN